MACLKYDYSCTLASDDCFNHDRERVTTRLYVIATCINQLLMFVRSIGSTNPKGKVRGMSVLYCIQSEGLVDNNFLAHCLLGDNKHVVSPQEMYECLPSPSGTV